MTQKTAFFRAWLKSFLIALVIVVAYVWFIGNWYIVSSSSMEGTLYTGDLVYVNKLAYGPRLPYTPFSLPFERGHSSWLSFSYRRLPGYSEVKRGDVVAFNYPDLDTLVPIDHKSVWVKRVVAMPGDTLVVKNARVWANGSRLDSIPRLKFNYQLKISGDAGAFFMRYPNAEPSRISNNNDWIVSVSASQAKEMRHDRQVLFLSPRLNKKGVFQAEVYPYELDFKWNQDFMGPIIIPRKGDSIELNLRNIPIYRLCIEAYEHRELFEVGNRFYIDGKPSTHYVFQQDYYFVMGDNRHQSSDSRYWGFLPESHLIGRVSGILFSIDKEQGGFGFFRFSRCLNIL